MVSINSVLKKITEINKRYLIAGGIVTLFIIGTLFLFFKENLLIHKNISRSVDMVPENAIVYAEVKDISRLQSIYKESDISKDIFRNRSWQNLTSNFATGMFNTILYFLGIKSGEPGNYTNLISLIDGNSGFALFPDQSWLSITKADLKSKIGAGIVQAFKAERIKVEPKKEKSVQENSKNDKNTPAQFSDVIEEEIVPIGNLEASKINAHGESIYFLLVSDYLFVSNNLNTLKKSLKIATLGSGGLKSKKGFDKILKEYESSETDILLFFDNKNIVIAPFMNHISKSEGTAVTINFNPHLNGKIFHVGISGENNAKDNKKINTKTMPWENIIPADFTVAYISSNRNLSEFIKSIQNLHETWEPFKANFAQFIMAVQPEKEELHKSGSFALVAHDFRKSNESIVPDFSLLYNTEHPSTALLKAVFKSAPETTKSFQNLKYSVMNNRQESYYSPSHMYRQNIQFQSSYFRIMEEYIATLGGRKSSVSDISTFRQLGNNAKGDHHIILNIPKLINNIILFYEYGAENHPEYTSKTIEQDIIPLFQPFSRFNYFHAVISDGLNPAGTFIVSKGE